ncbi:heavy-metal-associated domain-containing protein [Mucilaginibacter sp. HMF5004]|uniref:heavy-metal-associated domain-containing protein n=1 Tax=Mucilaginibacter rivuli TaxID=2857527 RepID=UPI001C5CEFEF|nr:heavy metal-associated domain-containing protein [Mucilaginibacter rivuli]MBW4890433.1 heavy-metal-associated domain-containing protein [Mucilaginibacter rivuli]
MKNFIIFFALVATIAQAKAQFIKAELEVSGLTCSMCSLSTQKALNTLDFVGQIKPDLNKNIFYITFKADKAVNLDAIKQKVKAAGFSVSTLIAVYNFNGAAVTDSRFTYNGSIYQLAAPPAKTLNGDVRLQIVDKDFVSPATFKKYTQQVKDPAYTSGINDKKQRVYHVIVS